MEVEWEHGIPLNRYMREKACSSPTLMAVVRATRKRVFMVKSLTEVQVMGPKEVGGS